MPTLTNDSSPGAYDGHRVLVDHVHALRDKLQAVAIKVGDDVKIPVGSLSEILNITSGEAIQLRMNKRTTAPTHLANKGFIYLKEVSGVIELFYKDSSGNEVQLTGAGYLKTPLTTKGDILTRTTTALVRLGLGSNGQVLTVNTAVPRGIEWSAAGGTDADAIHKSVRQEIQTITEQSSPNVQDLLVLEAYSEVLGSEWQKRRVTVNNLRQDCNAAWLQGNIISAAAPNPSDTLVWSGSQWQPQAGGSGTVDRLLIISDDTEFSEVTTSYDIKKTFRVVFDSAKSPTSWRFVAEIWCAGGNGTTDTVECLFDCGVDQITLSTVVNAAGSAALEFGGVAITEPDDTLLTATIQLRVQPGSSGTAHVKYTDCFLVY
jgi:hypothetical protein